MTRAEQNRLIEELAPLQYKMTPKDKASFLGLQKRHKDDEDLDAASADRLRELHQAYKPPKSRKELDDLWSKLTSAPPKS